MCVCHPIGAGDYESIFKDTETGEQPRKATGTTQTDETRGAPETTAESVRLRSCTEIAVVSGGPSDRPTAAGESDRWPQTRDPTAAAESRSGRERRPQGLGDRQ